MPQRKISVLQIIPALRMGGPGYVVSGLIKNLDRARYDLTLCTMYELPKSLEIPIPALEQGIPWVRLRMNRFLEVRAWRCLNLLINSGKFDIVHTHLTRADWYGRTVARWCSYPKVVSTIHNQDRFLYVADLGALRGRVVSALNRLSMLLADKLVAISEGVRQYLLEVEGIPPQKVAVVRNGIQLEQFDPSVDGAKRIQQGLGIPENAFVIGTVAVLNSRKGLVHLVQAARTVVSQVPKSYFLLVGGGPQEAELRQLVANLGLEGRVLFCGQVSHTQVLSFVRAMDVFVLPSLIEGFGLAVLEAQALEKPCVVTNIPGLSEAVAPGQTAIVVPPGEEHPLADAILSLLADEQKRKTMGKAARRFVEEQYAASRMADKYEEVYEEVLRVRQSPTHSEVE